MLKIKEIREEKKLSQDEMVAKTGIPKRSYVNYENEKSDIPLSKLQNIASVLNVRIEELLSSTNRINEPSENYDNATLQSFRAEVKEDLKVIHDSLVTGVESLSEGIFHGLKDQQKILKFIDKLNPDEINGATKNLNRWLEDHKE